MGNAAGAISFGGRGERVCAPEEHAVYRKTPSAAEASSVIFECDFLKSGTQQ